MVAKVLTKLGSVVQSWKIVHKAVVHTVLLYGSDIWVVTVSMLKFQEGFWHRVVRRIAGKTDWHAGDRGRTDKTRDKKSRNCFAGTI